MPGRSGKTTSNLRRSSDVDQRQRLVARIGGNRDPFPKLYTALLIRTLDRPDEKMWVKRSIKAPVCGTTNLDETPDENATGERRTK